MNNKGVAIIFMMLIVLVQFASALDTKILVRSEPFHNIILRIQNPVTKSEMLSVYGKTNVSGTVAFNYTTSNDKLDFTIIVRLFGETVLTKEFDDITARPLITLSTYNESEESVPATTIEPETTTPTENNLTTNSSIVTQDNPEDEASSITGRSISSDETKIFSSKILYYILGGILLAGIFMMILRRSRNSKSTPPHELTVSDELDDIEKKLRDASREIRDLKNKNASLEKTQKEYMQAKEKLERVSGYKPRPEPAYRQRPEYKLNRQQQNNYTKPTEHSNQTQKQADTSNTANNNQNNNKPSEY